jgi:hypothetical protein
LNNLKGIKNYWESIKIFSRAGKLKNKNMKNKKEKLTPKIISKEIIENFDTLKLSWNGMTGIEFHILTFLEQIKDEIFYELNTSTESRNIDIKNVFNKYLNEK